MNLLFGRAINIKFGHAKFCRKFSGRNTPPLTPTPTRFWTPSITNFWLRHWWNPLFGARIPGLKRVIAAMNKKLSYRLETVRQLRVSSQRSYCLSPSLPKPASVMPETYVLWSGWFIIQRINFSYAKMLPTAARRLTCDPLSFDASFLENLREYPHKP